MESRTDFELDQLALGSPHFNDETQGDPASNPEQSLEDVDISSLRISQDFVSMAGVTEVLNTVDVRKPNKPEFVRVHPDPSFCLQTKLLADEENKAWYLVHPDLWSDLSDEMKPMVLYTATNRYGGLFLWPIRLPDENGNHNSWSASALQGAELAKSKWVRLIADHALKAYRTIVANAPIPDPVWPKKQFKEILDLAFKNGFITSLEHPVIRRLRGEI